MSVDPLQDAASDLCDAVMDAETDGFELPDEVIAAAHRYYDLIAGRV